MLSKEAFWDWFKKEVQIRWSNHHFEWTEVGDWHWRLQDFDTETLTEAVRQHKACECYPIPNLKKVYEYAQKIDAVKHPKAVCDDRSASGIPEAHTFIMCIDKDDRGRGTLGWFVDIILWPLNRTWAAADYARVAAEQARTHADFYGGQWEVFTNTNQREMLQCAAAVRGTKPLNLAEPTEPRQ